jgi:hypothetical protein
MTHRLRLVLLVPVLVLVLVSAAVAFSAASHPALAGVGGVVTTGFKDGG